MHHRNVDALEPQPFQARFQRAHDLALEVGEILGYVVDLRRNDRTRAQRGEGLAEMLLRPPAPVIRRGVEVVDTQVERAADDCRPFLLRALRKSYSLWTPGSRAGPLM